MAEDKLGKVVRIDDRTYDPKGAKLEVWTKGRHKYLVKYLDPKVVDSSDAYYYINRDKISASLTDDEVIKEWLAEKEAAAKSNTSLQVYKVIQDPYSDNEITKRVYGDGKSPYYLNNGCSINIEWIGKKPNPNFTLGTFSNPEDAEDYYRRKINGVGNGPDRFLKNTSKNPVILTSSVDDADDTSKLPTSTWVVETPFPMGVDINSQPAMSEPNYRDKSYVFNKVVTVNLPKGFTENGGKGYLVWTEGGLQYDSKAIPEGTSFESRSIGRSGSGSGGRPEDQIVYFRSRDKDSDIIQKVIENFKRTVTRIQGISYDSYDLKLCSPDSEACSLIEYKSPLEAANNRSQPKNDVIPGPSQSSTKIKLSIQGLFDVGDGTTPGNTSSVFEIKAKTNMPAFTVWSGEIPKTEEIDVFEDLPELDSEYIESRFTADEEQEIKFQLSQSFETGETDGTEDSTTTQANTNTNTNTSSSPLPSQSGGGIGIRRFQKSLTLNGQKVFNGEIPDAFLEKLDFSGIKLERHAARKLNQMNVEFKAKFGQNIQMNGGYRTFNTQNEIFDWPLFDIIGKGRKLGTNGGTAAAKPGTSQHGWGLAIDTSGMGDKGSAKFDFLEQIGPKYGWFNPSWAKKLGAGHEPWHREYKGDDKFKNDI
jgi:LAS superfamily LD-carboxypeptidase LdcB